LVGVDAHIPSPMATQEDHLTEDHLMEDLLTVGLLDTADLTITDFREGDH
jgi:hypothetical protein